MQIRGKILPRRAVTPACAILFIFVCLQPHIARAQESANEKNTLYKKAAHVFHKIAQSPFPTAQPPEYTSEALQDILLYNTLAGITKPIAPFSYGKYMVFIYYNEMENSRTYISFAHENYETVHPFVLLESNPKVMVYIQRKYPEPVIMHYRLVVNGVWMRDPQNPVSTVDINGVHVSVARVKALPDEFMRSVTYNPATRRARFRLRLDTTSASPVTNTSLKTTSTTAISHEKNAVYLVGSFTSWDPFLVRMKSMPNDENTYYADVVLGPGRYYYYFQVGNYDIIDPKNKSIVPRRIKGLYVSTISINESTNPDEALSYTVAKK